MARYRRVVAPDAMGYGGSDTPPSPPQITDYARLLDDALDAANEGGVDLLGYHTGAIIAAELARLRPDRVGRLVLIGVPYFTGEEQQLWRERLAAPTVLGEDFEQFQERWDVRHAPERATVEV
jgi:pimeloyl-ACP methyl ester carboxylesterase